MEYLDEATLKPLASIIVDYLPLAERYLDGLPIYEDELEEIANRVPTDARTFTGLVDSPEGLDIVLAKLLLGQIPHPVPRHLEFYQWLPKKIRKKFVREALDANPENWQSFIKLAYKSENLDLFDEFVKALARNTQDQHSMERLMSIAVPHNAPKSIKRLLKYGYPLGLNDLFLLGFTKLDPGTKNLLLGKILAKPEVLLDDLHQAVQNKKPMKNRLFFLLRDEGIDLDLKDRLRGVLQKIKFNLT